MAILTVRTRVMRYTNRHDFEGRQELQRVWRLFGIEVWSVVLDTEDVPSWAAIQRATLGYTEWRSKFAEHIK